MAFPIITSPANERVKRAARLRRSVHRREEQQTLLDGVRELTAALDAGIACDEVFFCPSLLGAEHHALMTRLAQRGSAVFSVTQSVIERLAFGERTEGVVAVITPPRRNLEDLVLPERPLVVVLEGVEKPGNVGAVVRTADAAGAAAVIVADGGTDLFNPNAIRASLGTIFQVPVCAAESSAVGAWLRATKLQLVAARLDGQSAPWEVDLSGPTAIVLGSEASGLSGTWAAEDIKAVCLPMLGRADSLNVSAAAAVLLYEALRQRQQPQ